VYYYLKPIVYMFMVAPDDELEPPTLSGRVLTELAIGFTALIILVVGLLSSPLYSVVHRAVTQSF
jgi:NADH:ubiquinone oxidoreductase subunit 2 (subunit N)